MPDLPPIAREAAEAEGLRRIPPSPMHFHGGTVIDMRSQDRVHFVAGFTECASRLPSEEDIEVAILGRTATQAAKAVRALIERGLGAPQD